MSGVPSYYIVVSLGLLVINYMWVGLLVINYMWVGLLVINYIKSA